MQHSYFSYWEKDAWFRQVDIAVIGSGIVGLSSAYFLKKKYPKKNIVVLERGFLPHGATTRNAGFACFGSATEILSDIEKNGREPAYQLVKERFDGLAQLLQLHGPDHVGYENLGGYEIFTKGEEGDFEKCRAQLTGLNSELAEVLNIRSDIYSVAERTKPAELGLGNIVGMIFNPWEGQLHSGMLVKNLVKLCRSVDIEILTGIEITSFESLTGKVVLELATGGELECGELVITTNGFAKQLVPDLNVSPARGQVMVTQPVEGLQLKGTFHHNEGFDYFRNIGNRILLGGGRNLDVETETTTGMEPNEKIMDYLHSFLNEVVAPGKAPRVEIRWSGIMGVGEEKNPIIRHIHPNVMVAVRMGGMGVAIGTNVGKKVAGLI